MSDVYDPFGMFYGSNDSVLGTGHFPDPFFDYTSGRAPRTITDAFTWAEFIYMRNGAFRQACNRIVNFFLTKVEYSEVSDDEREHWEKFHTHKMGLFGELAALGSDFTTYGNSLSSILIPFKRYLRCPRCAMERPISAWRYRFDGGRFHLAAACKCGWNGELNRIDRRFSDPQRVRVLRWSPHRVRTVYNSVSHDIRYLFRLPADLIQAIKSGREFELETTPWEFIECVLQNKDLEFNQQSIFHLREPTLAGIRNAGWGLPPVLSSIRQAYYLQVIQRYDEAIALDYIIPFRLLTPKAYSNTTGDPMRLLDMGNYKNAVMGMLSARRRDPAQWNFLPFPLEYAVYGGEAKMLSPADLKQAALDEFLNSIGTPPELYRMSLTTQAAPLALRLFTQMWQVWYAGINSWLDWSMDIVSNAFLWDRATAVMRAPSLADDVEIRQIQLQLAAAQRISLGTPLEQMGLDWKKEIDRRFEEMRYEQVQQQQMEDAMRNRQMQGEMTETALGAPADGEQGDSSGPLAGMTPGDIQSQAQDIASRAVQMPEPERRRLLAQVRNSSDTLHALVRNHMEKMRTQAESVGREQLVTR